MLTNRLVTESSAKHQPMPSSSKGGNSIPSLSAPAASDRLKPPPKSLIDTTKKTIKLGGSPSKFNVGLKTTKDVEVIKSQIELPKKSPATKVTLNNKRKIVLSKHNTTGDVKKIKSSYNNGPAEKDQVCFNFLS